MRQDPIVFVTHVSYLDGAIEHIKLASKKYSNLNVIVTLSPTQTFRNIIDIRHVDLENYSSLVDFNDVKKEWNLGLFEPYFENCRSVNFLLYHNSGIRNALLATKTLNRHIRSLKPQFIHFDSYVNRQIFQIPFIFANRKKIILNVHDAKPHSGEEDKIRMFLQRVLYRWCHNFVTFSDFSKIQLRGQLSSKKKIVNSFLLPFSYYKNYLGNPPSDTGNFGKISFVGRISKYKGIDLFIDAINIAHKKLPKLEFVIAGKPISGYIPDFARIHNPENVRIIQDHLSNSALVDIITTSQLVVCPYLDASQSGVVVTAIALNRPVLVTEAGGLKEYISEEINGMVCKISAADLASKIVDYSSNYQFVELNKKMKSDLYEENAKEKYLSILDDIYS